MTYKQPSFGPFKMMGSEPTNVARNTKNLRSNTSMKKNKEDKASGKIDEQGTKMSKGNKGAKPTMDNY